MVGNVKKKIKGWSRAGGLGKRKAGEKHAGGRMAGGWCTSGTAQVSLCKRMKVWLLLSKLCLNPTLTQLQVYFDTFKLPVDLI